jgi:murein DD-endopeptidase MepM/ murein hydrolase activator NlpD
MRKYVEKGDSQIVESEYIWPVGRSNRPDEIKTSFNPRNKRDKWHFHNGIDLPAATGTPVYAIHSGKINLAAPSDPPRFKSGHVVIKVEPKIKNTRALFLVYLQLGRIGENIKKGVKVEKGDYIGNVGADDANYPHLHIEFRKANSNGKFGNRRINPLNYLPYPTVRE